MRLSTTTGVLQKRFGYAKAIKMIAEAGFDAYDIDMCRINVENTPIAESGYLDFARQLNKVSEKCGIICNQAHAPFPTQLNGNDEYNKKTFDMIVRSMELASMLGAEIIVMHPIKNSSSSHLKDYTFKNFESRKQLYEANLRFFERLIPYCEKTNITIAVENMWERHPLRHDTLIPAILGYAEEHSKFIEDVGSERIVACLDIGHSLICGEKPDEAIYRLDRSLKSLHVHDSNGYEDSHAMPYSLNADWSAILKALADIEYDGDFTFEVLSPFFKNCPDELYPEALRHMCSVGRYMVSEIEKCKK